MRHLMSLVWNKDKENFAWEVIATKSNKERKQEKSIIHRKSGLTEKDTTVQPNNAKAMNDTQQEWRRGLFI